MREEYFKGVGKVGAQTREFLHLEPCGLRFFTCGSSFFCGFALSAAHLLCFGVEAYILMLKKLKAIVPLALLPIASTRFSFRVARSEVAHLSPSCLCVS